MPDVDPQMLAAAQAYLGGGAGAPPPMQQSFIPGVQNTGLGGPQAILPPTDPGSGPPGNPGLIGPPPPGPPPPPPGTFAGGFSPAPPPPATVAAPASYAAQGQVPQPSPPAPPPAPRTIVTQTGATPAHEALRVGPTQIGLLNRAEGERIAGVEGAAEFEKKAALQQAMAATVARDEAAAQMQAQQQAEADQQKQLAEAGAKVRAASESTQQTPITDYWADRSTGKKIGNALMIGLAGFGQAISGDKGPNQAMAMLQGEMDRDLRTKQLRFQQQSEQNKNKKDIGQQQFDNLVRQFGMVPAKDMWAAAQRQKVAAEASIQAATAKIPETDANLVKLKSDLLAQADERRATALMQYIPAQGGQQQYIHPDLGVQMSRKEYLEYVQKRSLEGQQQEGRVQIEGLKAGAKGGEGTKFIAEKLQAANIPRTLSAVDDAAKDYGAGDGKPVDESGLGPGGKYVWETYGPKAYEVLHGKKAAQREQNWAIVKDETLKSLVGRVTPEMYDRMQSALDGANSADSRRHLLDVTRRQLQSQANTIKAGAGQGAAAAFDENLGAVAPQKLDTEPVE